MLTQDVQQIAPRAPAEGHSGGQRVLVAFDGSDGAWAALQQAIAVAVSNGAVLTIAGVVQEPRFVWAGPGAIAVPSGFTRQSSIRNTWSRSTATGSLSLTTNALAGNGLACPSPSSRRSHMKVPA